MARVHGKYGTGYIIRQEIRMTKVWRTQGNAVLSYSRHCKNLLDKISCCTIKGRLPGAG